MIDPLRGSRGLPLFLFIAASLAALPAAADTAGKPTSQASMRPSLFSFSAEACGFGGMTGMPGRPALERTAYSIDAILSVSDARWTYFALGADYVDVNESIPDPTLFLYRGYGGNSLFVEGGPRFALAGLGFRPLAKSRVETLGGAGVAATEDTGTTLVSLVPFLRFDIRLVNPLSPFWGWSIGIPVEVQRRATAITGMAGLSLAIVVRLPEDTK